ncbi:aminotransferase class III-fold pyridoxal phosphate-dependent enzyme [Actinosynnema pretiosum subsp. pretiosum]|uniref:alanine--glyoxylate transaminase n=2 Tax=Actinosynnema TaxID=40566 RepID=C6WGY1_ACTMD|nr:aminotransferase class III-fold pyridoxal phosphate-dependent enzyme [Actinosynnema mirum]ACU36049.1 aminotransferase class-III [Actinosynnema mirum DSM 43827]AXX29503.1 putative aminotransferase [Actinosynnema pretiosum subsp. pretiosum]QUF06259.1 aminotransferase class III-fold pyridoxal phosphate-dependent enzyme [Actinosynnema pretiosum subsp. pretiosum]
MAHDELLARHRAVLPDWMALYYDHPIEITRGSGRHVTDGEGRTYLDFFAGILTNGVGYDIAEISDAIRSQIDTGVLHSSTLYLIRSQVELAERIAGLSGIPDAKVFFTNSGTEANETALMLACGHRRSDQVLALRNSYHGRGFAATGVTGLRAWSPTALSPLKVAWVHGGYRYRSPFRDLSDADYVAACVADLRDVLNTATSGDVACMIVEPIQGVGGFTLPPDGLFAAFKEVLDEHGILLISDEVQTGWGRTGEHFWGIGAHGVTPDAMTFAKGLGNGLAIGGVVARGDVVDGLTANSISTFGGNPVSTAGALATLDYLLDHDLQSNAAKLGARLISGLRDVAADHPLLGDVRGKGLMVGLELVGEDRAPDPAAAVAVLEATRERGLLVGKGGLHGNVIRLAPPLSVTADEVEEALVALRDAVAEVSAR